MHHFKSWESNECTITTTLHLFNSLFSGTIWVGWYQKGKTSLDLSEARDDGGWGCGGISWTICKQSAPRCRQITTPAPHHSIFTGQMLFLSTVSKHWSNEYLHITLWHCCVLQSEATVCVGTCVLTTTALIPLCWIMSACQPPYWACQVTVVVFCYNIFCLMTSCEPLRWLVETLSRDFYHYWMLMIDHAILQYRMVTWPCITASYPYWSALTCGVLQQYL